MRPHVITTDPDSTDLDLIDPAATDPAGAPTTTTSAPTTSTSTAGASADPAWLGLSAMLTEIVPDIADREDLVVTIAPGAGRGSPGVFFPTKAMIEVNGAHLPVKPATVAPYWPGDRARYPGMWGVLTHECGHARHTAWTPPEESPAGVLDAAMLLEESRIEAAQIRRRPDDRYWLRASAISIVLEDLPAHDPARAPGMTAGDAGRAAALILGRVDAGILNPAETTPVRDTVTTVLGADTLTALREVWQAAQATADDDAEAMLDHGRRWCEILGIDPDTPPADPGTPEPGTPGDGSPGEGTPGDGAPGDGASGTGAPGEGTDPAGGGSPELSPLAKSINETMGKLLAALVEETPPGEGSEPPGPAPASDPHDAVAEAAEGRVFDRHIPSGATRTRGTRLPRPNERIAAATLARALNTAGVRERAVTKVTSATPPGRLRMRGALAAAAQRAAGQIPTAEPFVRTTRRLAPAPPLRLGIACDVSGSMRPVTGPVASAAWILARAAHLAHGDATTATVLFGYHVRPITRPGEVPTHVTEFHADDGTEDAITAIDALDSALGLSRPDAARLLVIVSDGYFVGPGQPRGTQRRLDRLRAAGCGVLWLLPVDWNPGFTGVTYDVLTDPATTAATIGRAAVAALRAAH